MWSQSNWQTVWMTVEGRGKMKHVSESEIYHIRNLDEWQRPAESCGHEAAEK